MLAIFVHLTSQIDCLYAQLSVAKNCPWTWHLNIMSMSAAVKCDTQFWLLNLGGLGRALVVNHAKVVRNIFMLEETYGSMVTTTLMYAMCNRALMDKSEKLKDFSKHDCRILFTFWTSMDFYVPHGLLYSMFTNEILIDEEHKTSFNWNAQPDVEFQCVTVASSHVSELPAILALLWPCVLAWIKDGIFVA